MRTTHSLCAEFYAHNAFAVHQIYAHNAFAVHQILCAQRIRCALSGRQHRQQKTRQQKTLDTGDGFGVRCWQMGSGNPIDLGAVFEPHNTFVVRLARRESADSPAEADSASPADGDNSAAPAEGVKPGIARRSGFGLACRWR
jgi:hypothetical protein